jgi:hypothetical protein
MKYAYKILVGVHEKKRTSARPRRKWENNITVGREETGLAIVDWTRLAGNRTRR